MNTLKNLWILLLLGVPSAFAAGDAGLTGSVFGVRESIDGNLETIDIAGRNGSLNPRTGERDGELPFVELATLHLPNGNHVVFAVNLDEGDLSFIEAGMNEETSPAFPADPRISILEKYLMLTDATTPVPELLVALTPDDDDAHAMMGPRRIVDRMETPIHVAEARMADLPTPFDKAAVTYNCYGSDTAANFEAVHCNYSGSAVDYCDSGKWYYLIRTSPLKAKNSFSRTTYCGEDTGKATHLRYSATNKCCNFPGISTASYGHNSWFWKHVSGPRRYRRVVQYRGPYPPWTHYQHADGYVRCFTLFFD